MRAKADKNINTGEYFQQGHGTVVITASDAMQYSFEGDDLEGKGKRSIFTSAIVEGLKTGNADLNGQISYEELYDYAYERIRNETPYQRSGKLFMYYVISEFTNMVQIALVLVTWEPGGMS